MKKSVCMKGNGPLIHTDYRIGIFPHSFRRKMKSENCKCKLDTRMIKIVQRKPALSITQQARLALSRMP